MWSVRTANQVERKVLEIMDEKGAISAADVWKRTGIPTKSINKAIERLLENRVIFSVKPRWEFDRRSLYRRFKLELVASAPEPETYKCAGLASGVVVCADKSEVPYLVVQSAP
jgi:DNA-binding Lrp family transcriptional regulator